MIYVIGGNGFVGSAIVRACKRKHLEHSVISHDKIDEYNGTSCDILINANGNSKKYMSEREPLWDFDASVRSVRASLVNIKARKYIHLSSCDVYPDCSSPETTREDQIIEVTRQSAYGFHKYLAELCVMRHATEWLIFRMSGFVGTGLVKNAIFDILQGGPLWLDPDSELQFIDVDKAADIIIDLAVGECSGEIYNLCGIGTIRLSEVISMVPSQIKCVPNAPRVKYEIAAEKLSKKAKLPFTHECVREYVTAQLKSK